MKDEFMHSVLRRPWLGRRSFVTYCTPGGAVTKVANREPARERAVERRCTGIHSCPDPLSGVRGEAFGSCRFADWSRFCFEAVTPVFLGAIERAVGNNHQILCFDGCVPHSYAGAHRDAE